MIICIDEAEQRAARANITMCNPSRSRCPLVKRTFTLLGIEPLGIYILTSSDVCLNFLIIPQKIKSNNVMNEFNF